MEDISHFRGMAGEVVKSFIRPSIFLTAIPIFIFWILVGAFMIFLGRHLPGLVQFIIIIVAASLLIARFAIPASRGELDAGFFNSQNHLGESFNFALRYCIFTILWVIPVALLAWLAVGNMTNTIALGMGRGMGGPSLAQLGFHGLLLAIILLIFMLAPTLCCILTTYTESFSEIFSFEPWRWLFQDRRADLASYYSSIIGGIFVFWVLYFIPLLFVAVLAFKSSTGFGMVVSAIIYLLPFALAPVLIGRLSGAFIAGESEFSELMDTETTEVNMMGSSDPDIAKAAATGFTNRTSEAPKSETAKTVTQSFATSTSIKPEQLDEIKAKVKDINETDIADNITRTKNKFEAEDDNILMGTELAYLYLRTDKIDEAVDAISKTISLALRLSLLKIALKLYLEFVEHRTKFKLKPVEFQQLGNILLKNEHYANSGWCIYTAMRKAQDLDNIDLQKKFLATADAASKAGKTKEAFSLYSFFVKKFENSTLADYAKTEAQKEQKHLQ